MSNINILKINICSTWTFTKKRSENEENISGILVSAVQRAGKRQPTSEIIIPCHAIKLIFKTAT